MRLGTLFRLPIMGQISRRLPHPETKNRMPQWDITGLPSIRRAMECEEPLY